MQAAEIWQAALGELQLQVSKANYQTWLKDTVGLSYHNKQFMIGTPNAFTIEWLEKRLKPQIEETLCHIVGSPIEIHFLLSGKENAAPTTPYPTERPKFNPKYTFSSFIVGDSNRLPHAAALGVAKKPGATYNPLFIYGGVGLGKTHLLHAIGHVVNTAVPRVIYATAEQFTNEFITSLKEGKPEEFDHKYRGVDVLLLDDIQFIAGKEKVQERLFHTFNDLHNANRQIVLSSDRHPRTLSLLEERLRSRFEWGLITDIQPPDFETRVAILQAKAESQEVEVLPELLYFIARRIQSNIRELEGALNRVIAFAQIRHTTPTSELAAQALAETTADYKRTLTAELIINTVAEYFKLTPEMLRGQRRDKPISFARQIAMYLLREEMQCHWSEIGRELGGRDHKGILYGYNKIAAEIEVNDALRREVLQVKEFLYSKAG
jgi:chromosomal replication initiator protein